MGKLLSTRVLNGVDTLGTVGVAYTKSHCQVMCKHSTGTHFAFICENVGNMLHSFYACNSCLKSLE